MQPEEWDMETFSDEAFVWKMLSEYAANTSRMLADSTDTPSEHAWQVHVAVAKRANTFRALVNRACKQRPPTTNLDEID